MTIRVRGVYIDPTLVLDCVTLMMFDEQRQISSGRSPVSQISGEE